MRPLLLLALILVAQARADWLDRYHDGERLLEQGKTEEALRELKTALHEAETSSHSKHGLGAILDGLGRAELSAGRFRAAQKYFERSAGYWENGTDECAVALSNAGQASQALGDYARAEKSFRQALEIMPRRSDLWRFLGAVLFLQHRNAEAETAERNALALGNPEVKALVWNDLAVIFQAEHKNQQAADMLALAIAATSPGQKRATMLYNVGMIEWKLGSRQQSETHLRQALIEMEAAIGPEHPDIGRILDAYSMMLQKTGRKPEAKQIAKRARAIRSSFAAHTALDRTTVDWRDLR